MLREDNIADVNLEFQEAVLPAVERGIVIIMVAYLVILLLSFKWPKFARAFLVTELIGWTLWSMLPWNEQEY